jgi:hypothetical protein
MPDANGDGRADVCMRRSSGVQCWLSTGSGWRLDALFDTDLFANSWDQRGQGDFDDDNVKTLTYPDVTGDGLPDVCVRNDYGVHCYVSSGPYITSGSNWSYDPGYDTTLFDNGWYQEGYGSFDNDNWPTLGYPDVNGDGKSDVCVRMDYGLHCYVSTGSGFAAVDGYKSNVFNRYWEQYSTGTFDSDNSTNVWWPDVNADGKADACVRNDWGMECVLSTGSGWRKHSEFNTLNTGRILANNTDQRGEGSFDGDNRDTIQFADVNGDGRPDVCVRNDYGLKCWPNGEPLDLVSSISNGLGGSVELAFVPSSSFSNTQLPYVFQVLGSITTSDGGGGVAT